jgi:prolyl-tRNA synthetase
MIWPESIAPFQIHLLSLGDDEGVLKEAGNVYEKLVKSGVEVLFDDRAGLSAGEKFAEADLIGIPYRAVVSLRSVKENGIELKKRNEEKGKIVNFEELLKILETRQS